MLKVKKKQRHLSFTSNYLQFQALDSHNTNYEFRIKVLNKLSKVEMPYIGNLGGHFFIAQTLDEKETNYRQSMKRKGTSDGLQKKQNLQPCTFTCMLHIRN